MLYRVVSRATGSVEDWAVCRQLSTMNLCIMLAEHDTDNIYNNFQQCRNGKPKTKNMQTSSHTSTSDK